MTVYNLRELESYQRYQIEQNKRRIKIVAPILTVLPDTFITFAQIKNKRIIKNQIQDYHGKLL